MKGVFAMVKPRIVASIMVAGLIGVGTVLSAQGARPADNVTTLGALLEEVRGLRAELRQLAERSVNADLMVARLQVQQRRVETVDQELAGVRHELVAVRTEVVGREAGIGQWQGELPSATERNRQNLVTFIATGQARLDQSRKREQDLMAREAELLRTLKREQTRWMEINDRLDRIERELVR
jgi:hypothetical protein